MCKCSKLKILINKDFLQYKKGSIITVDAKDCIPVSKFWRDRLRDSKIDDCVSIVKPTKKVVKKIKQETEQ